MTRDKNEPEKSGCDQDDLSVEEWLRIRKEAALKIDPETTEVTWHYGYTLDPYGIDPDLPEELKQIGRVRFARSPGSDIWVSFGDLPEGVLAKIGEIHRRNPPPAVPF